MPVMQVMQVMQAMIKRARLLAAGDGGVFSSVIWWCIVVDSSCAVEFVRGIFEGNFLSALQVGAGDISIFVSS